MCILHEIERLHSKMERKPHEREATGFLEQEVLCKLNALEVLEQALIELPWLSGASI